MQIQNMMIGIDLNIDQPQICFFEAGSGKSGVMPMKIGNAAVSLKELLGNPERIGRDSSAVTLADILKEVFKTIGVRSAEREIGGVCITAEKLDGPMAALLKKVFARLDIPKSRSMIQDYKESFYYYLMYQKKELYARDAAVFRFQDRSVFCSQLESGRRVNPAAMKVTDAGSAQLPEGTAEERDRAFAGFVDRTLKNRIFSGIFLTGEGVEKTVLEGSRVRLGKNGLKVFSEDALFALGACNAVRDKLLDKQIRNTVYIGDTRAQFNLGVDLLVKGKKICYRLVSGGKHWFDSEADCEFLLGEDASLNFVVTSLTAGGRQQSVMRFPGLPKRPPYSTRMHLHVEFISGIRCRIEVRDLGFGEIYPSSGKVWVEELEGAR